MTTDTGSFLDGLTFNGLLDTGTQVLKTVEGQPASGTANNKSPAAKKTNLMPYVLGIGAVVVVLVLAVFMRRK